MAISSQHPSLFVFGQGYTTTGLARQAQRSGW
jgi:hypothetical protein